ARPREQDRFWFSDYLFGAVTEQCGERWITGRDPVVLIGNDDRIWNGIQQRRKLSFRTTALHLRKTAHPCRPRWILSCYPGKCHAHDLTTGRLGVKQRICDQRSRSTKIPHGHRL